jgi:hypothetical protein
VTRHETGYKSVTLARAAHMVVPLRLVVLGAALLCAARGEDAAGVLEALEAPLHVLVGAAGGAAAGLHALPLQTSDSVCESAKDEAACGAAASDCRWCKCKAVPSVCVDSETAARLPPTVFACGVPTAPALEGVSREVAAEVA